MNNKDWKGRTGNSKVSISHKRILQLFYIHDIEHCITHTDPPTSGLFTNNYLFPPLSHVGFARRRDTHRYPCNAPWDSIQNAIQDSLVLYIYPSVPLSVRSFSTYPSGTQTD